MNAPKISAPMLLFFRRIVRGYFRRHFHGVRINGAERIVTNDGPLIIYANHSSWWDPMVCILLADKLMRKRRHYAPMDAEALDRYAVLKQFGIFPVDKHTSRGAVQFLRMGETILESGGVLWITPQGEFVDARQKPLDFKPGLATLARRVAERCGHCTVLPLAIEYPFWDERLPETLLHFGHPVRLTGSAITGANVNADAVQVQLVAALEEAMGALQETALLRDATRFTTLLGGTLGTGGFYAFGLRLKALIRRRPYRPEHTVSVKADAVGESRG